MLWCPNQDLNHTPHEYKSEALLLEPACSVVITTNKKGNVHITLQHVRLTTVEMEMQQRILYIGELHVAHNNLKILSVAQQCSDVKFMSPTTTKHKKKVKQSRYRPGVAQRVPGS